MRSLVVRCSLFVELFSCCLAFFGCEEKCGSRHRAGTSMTSTYIFVDRSDAKLEYAYVIGRNGVFAQVCVFPGHTNRGFFFLERLPGRMAKEVIRWQEQAAEIKPPFLPGGPWFSRTRVPSSSEQPASTEYFANANSVLRNWLIELRTEVTKEEHSVARPPDWVSEDTRIRAWLGM
jgi:hypothetical protein